MKRKIFLIIINIVLFIILVLMVTKFVKEKQYEKKYGKKEYEIVKKEYKIVIKDKYEIVAPILFSSRTEFHLTYETRCLNRPGDTIWKERDNSVSRKTYTNYNVGDTITKQGSRILY